MSECPGIAPFGEPTDFEGCLARVNPSKASLEAMTAVYGSPDWQLAQAARRAALENSITVATTGMPTPG